MVIGKSVVSIDNYAFWDCTSLTSLILPDCLESIGGNTFKGCAKLTSVFIPKNVKTIGHLAFDTCSDLVEIYFDGDAPSVDNNAFQSVAPGATAYVYPTAEGFPIEGEFWSGLIVKYRFEETVSAPFSVNIQSSVIGNVKFSGQKTLVASFQLRSNLPNQIIQNTQGLRLAYDNTVLQLISWNAESAIADPVGGAHFVPTSTGCGNIGVFGDLIHVYSAKTLSGETGFLSISLSDPDATYECPLGEYITLGEVRFAFRLGKDASDLNEDSIRIMDTNELFNLNQSCLVIINDVLGVSHTYGRQYGGIAFPGDDALEKPTFTWIIPTGVKVTGIVKSYNPKHVTTLSLIQDNVEMHKTNIAATTESGQMVQAFTFEDVEPGKYSLVVAKKCHTLFTVKTIIVEDEDVDLTLDGRPEVRSMALRCGDIDSDGLINDMDLTALWMLVNYNRKTSDAAKPLCDLNGDGIINDADLTILWMAYNYNRGEIVIS